MRIALCAFVIGCSAASRAPEPEPAPAASPEPRASESPEPAPAAAETTATPPSAAPVLPAQGPTPATPRLPSLAVQSIGMHIGGGANDPASKAPFLRAVEAQFPAFLECFRLAAEPGSGGTFGVDLRIGPGGGQPVVEEPRTAIAGEEFRSCMLAAFERASFEPTKKPVVISYSVRFTLGPR